MASAWLFNQTAEEMKELGTLTDCRLNKIKAEIKTIANQVYEHESRIVDMIFEKGGIRTVSKEDMLLFIRNRIDVVLSYLKMKPLFGDKQGVVSEWFYNQLSTYKYADFFHSQQIQYVRNWQKHKLVFKGA